MKNRKQGDTSKGLCEACRKLVKTRYEYRTVTLTEPAYTEVPGVLVSVCQECFKTVSIPHQSAPMLQQARREAKVYASSRLAKAYSHPVSLAARRGCVGTTERAGSRLGSSAKS